MTTKLTQNTNKIKTVVTALARNQWFFVLVVLIVVSVFTHSMNPRFFRLTNILNVLERISVLGIVAAGATILIVSGNFDISVGANLGLSACVMAILIRMGYSSEVAVALGILSAIGANLVVGASSVLFRAPSFITSLACISVFQGTALAITGAQFQTIYGRFEVLGATRLFGVIPLVFIVCLVVYVAVFVMLYYTLLGRRVHAIGSNPKAAYLAGINVNANKLIFFAINGLLVGIAAALFLSRVGSASATTGQGMEIRAIGSAVIGGAVMTGGKGSVLGTFLGALLMGVIGNSLNLLRVSPYFQDVSFGVVLLLALGVTSFSHAKERRGTTG